MIRVFLCDDDPSYLEYLSGIVGQFFQQNKIEAGIKTFLDGETLLEEPEMADLVFLDVEMPEKSGIEIFAETCGTVSDNRKGFYGDH